MTPAEKRRLEKDVMFPEMYNIINNNGAAPLYSNNVYSLYLLMWDGGDYVVHFDDVSDRVVKVMFIGIREDIKRLMKEGK